MAQIGDKIEIICLESPALQRLITSLALEISNNQVPWINEKIAMELLQVKSKTTFARYRDTGKIKFRKLSSKHILYKRTSILEFIENSKTDNHE
jgi:hypothetical protein